MNYTINEVDEYFEVIFNNEYKVSISNESMKLSEVDPFVQSNFEMYQNNYNNYTLSKVRKNRDAEFMKYDKYQLTLVWQELTSEQKTEYANWRNAWLEVTDTLVEPVRLVWFE